MISPIKDTYNDDIPFSLKELQGTTSQHFRVQDAKSLISSSLAPPKQRVLENVIMDEKHDKIKLNIPESIRKVKEEIKKKIEWYINNVLIN